MGLEHEEVTNGLLGAAVAVHRALGPGFVESIYERALALELVARGIPHARQTEAPIHYRGKIVGTHRLDFLVGGVVVELKAVTVLTDVHFAVVRSYLRALGVSHGLLLNFSKRTLEARRVLSTGDRSGRVISGERSGG